MATATLILGRPGAGKSRLLRRLLEGAPRVVVSDTLGEHSETAPGLAYDDALDALEDDASEMRFSVTPPDYACEEYLERCVAARRNLAFAVDELDFWYPSAQNPVGEGIRNLIRYGRHYGQHLYVCVRRPANVARDVSALADAWIFPLREPRDCAFIRAYCGVDPSTLPPPERDAAGRVVSTCVLHVGDGDTEDWTFAPGTMQLYQD